MPVGTAVFPGDRQDKYGNPQYSPLLKRKTGFLALISPFFLQILLEELSAAHPCR
jgi:hypothetical protein